MDKESGRRTCSFIKHIKSLSLLNSLSISDDFTDDFQNAFVVAVDNHNFQSTVDENYLLQSM